MGAEWIILAGAWLDLPAAGWSYRRVRLLPEIVPAPMPSISLIVPTRGRTWQIGRLLDSLAAQTRSDFEVIVVDQNPGPILERPLARRADPFALRHVHRPADKGISLARNVGWRLAAAEVLLFPDDDSWYPPDFLARGLDRMTALATDVLTGRSTDEVGRSINGRFSSRNGPITRHSVWVMQQEWITFVRRPLMERLGGYDESIGIGGATPWQAAEGPDLILRAIAAGAVCRYEPSLTAFHEEHAVRRPDAAFLAKSRGYNRGKGYVLRKHSRSALPLLYWLARPLGGALLSALSGDAARARFFANMALGRWEGWRGRPAGAVTQPGGLNGPVPPAPPAGGG